MKLIPRTVVIAAEYLREHGPEMGYIYYRSRIQSGGALEWFREAIALVIAGEL